MTAVKLVQLTKQYNHVTAVDRLDLEIGPGELVALLGPSGCGKTTTMRMIAGLLKPDAGFIKIGDEVWFDGQQNINRVPQKRKIGFVFQDYALFPHLDVAANIGFGLHRLTRAERERRVEELLHVVHLASVAKKYPHELSGGQQQRVALARALAPKPDLLLLDEPFSNLDVSLRERLSMEVREIIKNQGITAILVTHDQAEAFAIADVIGVMDHGEIQQWDTAFNLYHCPANRFVANFIGQGVFVPGKVIDAHQVEIELGILKGVIPQHCEAGCRVDVLLRPDDIVHDDASPLQAAVIHKAFRGAEILYTLRLASGAKVLALVPSHHDHAIGGKIGIKLEADHIVAFQQPEG